MDAVYRKLDPAHDPLSDRMIRDLIARGLPPAAVRDDRTLDPDVLAAHGWWISRGWVYGPPG